MPTYIALLKWTQQGISKVGSSAKRLDAGRKAFKKAGIEMDTVLIGRDASYNPELMRISSTVSLVDPALYRAAHVS